MLKGLLGQSSSAQVQVPKDNVMLFTESKVLIKPVVKVDANGIHTAHEVLPESDAKVLINPIGGLYYIYNCSLQYLKETKHLKEVEENIAIKSMFKFDTGKEQKRDVFNYLLIVALVITVFLLRG